jgi:hypothetical protein
MVLSQGGGHRLCPISATTWQAQVQRQFIAGTTVKLYALSFSQWRWVMVAHEGG